MTAFILGDQGGETRLAYEHAVEQAGPMYEAERLHRVRIAAKKLRYAMELAAESGTRAAAAPVKVIKRAQDALGRLHDLQVLQSHVAAVQARPRSPTSHDGGLDVLARLLEDECRHLHARYVSGIPALREVVETTRTAVVPQLAHSPRGGRRPLKMSLQGGKRRVAAAAAQS